MLHALTLRVSLTVYSCTWSCPPLSRKSLVLRYVILLLLAFTITDILSAVIAVLS